MTQDMYIGIMIGIALMTLGTIALLTIIKGTVRGREQREELSRLKRERRKWENRNLEAQEMIDIKRESERD